MLCLVESLTNQILDLYSASKEENKTKFEEIKNNIIKNLFYAGGAFLAINAGFNVFLGIAGRVAGLIAKLSAKILTAPFKAAGALANAAFRPNAPKPPSNTSGGGSTNVKPKGKFGFMSVVRGAITGLSGVMNFLNGENVDATSLLCPLYQVKDGCLKELETLLEQCLHLMK